MLLHLHLQRPGASIRETKLLGTFDDADPGPRGDVARALSRALPGENVKLGPEAQFNVLARAFEIETDDDGNPTRVGMGLLVMSAEKVSIIPAKNLGEQPSPLLFKDH